MSVTTPPGDAGRPHLRVGTRLPELRRPITRVGLFQFSVAYWSAHRIHWDAEFARESGYRDALVTANLLSAITVEAVLVWAGPGALLRTLEERNVAPAVAGDTVVVNGEVVAVEGGAEGDTATCAMTVTIADGVTVVRGNASVLWPAHVVSHA